MASSRDDFVIAIRSAFLKKSNKQKFSLLTLIFLSILIIILSSLDFKPIRQTRNVINEIVYRSSFIVSLPENFIKNSLVEIVNYSSFFEDYKKNIVELEKLKSEKISNKIITSENEELKALIDDYTLSSNKLLAKVIVDHNSPFLKSLIINKGSKDNIVIGTNIYDKNYLVGKVIEVNYKTSRVLLISDLNSNVPISIAPGNIQAIVTGSGENMGEIKYVKGNYLNLIDNESIAYTSGTGSIYKSGIPVGRIEMNQDQDQKLLKVNFYSNFSQLKYVFAEVKLKDKNSVNQNSNDIDENISQIQDTRYTDSLKFNLLNEQIEIYTNTNSKLIEENKKLESKLNELNLELSNLENKIESQKEIIDQNNLDKNEFEFLKLNLIYSKKCKKSFGNPKGYKFGTKEYRYCVMNKGRLQ
tara:strand:+ start:126 stop:1367 length:1242 start_codon:yes stop_codon:yes gene_type:complete